MMMVVTINRSLIQSSKPIHLQSHNATSCSSPWDDNTRRRRWWWAAWCELAWFNLFLATFIIIITLFELRNLPSCLSATKLPLGTKKSLDCLRISTRLYRSLSPDINLSLCWRLALSLALNLSNISCAVIECSTPELELILRRRATQVGQLDRPPSFRWEPGTSSNLVGSVLMIVIIAHSPVISLATRCLAATLEL